MEFYLNVPNQGNIRGGLLCCESKTRECPFTPTLHGFAQLNLGLLEGTVRELFVKVARVSVPIQFGNKWRSDSALKSLTKDSLANFVDLLDSWPISPPEKVMILYTVCTSGSQPLLWILRALVSPAIIFPVDLPTFVKNARTASRQSLDNS